MRTHIAIPILTVAAFHCVVSMAAVPANADRAASLVDRIRSTDEQVRSRAADEITKTREQLVDGLIEILEHPTSPSQQWLSASTPENLAIRLLGEMRAARAVPALILWTAQPEGAIDVDGVWRGSDSPARRALVAIGKPAESALINVLKQSPKTRTWEPSLGVLEQIEGRTLLTVILKEAIAAEKNPAAKKNLTEALARLEAAKTPKKAP